VPGDFSILGFDDSDVGERNLPRISSIHYDYQDYARRLVDVAIAAVEGEPTAGESVVPCTLTIKESCRKIQD
jgi:LacI family transcriptional regulator